MRGSKGFIPRTQLAIPALSGCVWCCAISADCFKTQFKWPVFDEVQIATLGLAQKADAGPVNLIQSVI